MCGGWFSAVLLGAVLAVGARPVNEEQERVLADERFRAGQQAAAATAFCEQLRTSGAATVAALDEESAAAKQALGALQKDLLAVLAKDDPATIRGVRARLATRQAALAAAEDDRALMLKSMEEAERDRDAWKKRVATLELALRLDMQVMLAGDPEIGDREQRVDSALKEIDYQSGHMAIYAARRANAALRWGDLHKLMAETEGSLNGATTPELRGVLAEHIRQLRRMAERQECWFLLNKQLEDRGRRNLAFARADYLVSRRYADALARKASARRADAALAAAAGADASLAFLRAALAPVQQKIAGELVGVNGQGDAALKALGDARTAEDQEQGHRAYAAAQAMKIRWEVERACWKEFVALQKAGAAFAHEVAERAGGLAEDRTVLDINQEERQLRESLVASEQYVHSLAMMVQKSDSQIESDRRAVGLSAQDVAALAQPFVGILSTFDAAKPPAPELVAGQFQSLAARFSGGNAGEDQAARRDEVGMTLVIRLAEREMIRARQDISERWMEHTHDAIKNLKRVAGTRLWQQHDPRLNGMTCLDVGTIMGAAASDAVFVWDCQRLALQDAPGVSPIKGLWWACVVVLLLAVMGVVVGRLIPKDGKGLWCVGKLAGCLPLPIGVGLGLLHLAAGNRALQGLGWLTLGVAVWLALRCTMLALTENHRRPPGTTLGGGIFAAVQAITGWTVILFPLYRLAANGTNAWETQAVIERGWLLGVCVALFRLLLHPALMGRVLRRRSEHPGLRRLGTAVAIACTTAATLAALPYLAGLDNLGGTVLHTVEASFALLGGALIGTMAAGWAMRRHATQTGVNTAWIRTAQTGVALAAGAAVLWMWWQFLNRVVLASNAPPLIQDVVKTVEQILRTALAVWRRELTSGMTVSSLVRGVLFFALSVWVSRVVKRHFLERVLARTPMDETTRLTFSAILGYVVILLGFLVGLNVAGSSLQNLALLAGAITVGLGFGLQNVINNFVSSLLIHFGRTIRVNDYIEVGGTRGTVREIGLRNTQIITDDGITVLVPNGSFVSANIVNWTNPSRRVRLHVPLTVMRQADLTAVAELSIAIARNHTLIVKDPAPVVEVRTLTATQIHLELLAWTEKPERLASIAGELSLALDGPLRERGFVS